jgi:FkbM family methyltransferase
METKIIRDNIFGIDLQFKDILCSGTIPYVFNELKNDRYGLEQIEILPSDTIIDVGANVGMFSIYAKKKFGCRVISFEPVGELFNFFKENILLNNLKLDDFELHNRAVFDKDDVRMSISTAKINTGCSSLFLRELGYSEQEILMSSECSTERLKKYIDDSCVYLKMDTEGSEHFIIPDIINELNTFKYFGAEFHDIGQEYLAEDIKKLVQTNFNGKLFL